ncbi:MAG: hypothetical protein KatS3mg108_2909 [Isosphaeraceae bacterium]|nr:MAG: hypothetical protein KatS3mg108_2909 [Isosphaeraceae bacterium]
MSQIPTTPRARDPDFDPVPRSAPNATGAEESYLRLVANPFLAIAVVLLTLWSLRLIGRLPWAGGSKFALGVAVLMIGFVLGLRGLRYHCLDCGGSGRLTRWRSHLCPAVAERRLSGQARRWRGPTPGLQLLLILWVLVAIVVFIGPGSFRF